MYHNHTLWWIFWITVVALLLIFFEPRWKKKKKNNTSPLEILQQRFARGEITKEEYEEKKAILERGSSTGSAKINQGNE
jgi:putative membrane protein